MKQALSQREIYCRVIYVGLCFMILYTALDSLRVIVSQSYREENLENLGQASIIIVYAFYGGFSFIAAPIIKKLGYKITMILSSISFTIYSFTGFVITYWPNIPKTYCWVIVLVGAALCGIGVAFIWVAQGAYVALIAGHIQKSVLYGLFWALYIVNQVLGFIIITFILGLIDKITYFLILTSCGCISTFMFFFVDNIEKQQQSQLTKSISPYKEEIIKIYNLLIDKRYRYFYIYLAILGSSTGFYITYLYALIVKTLPGQAIDQTKEDYQARLHYYEGWVLIVLGTVQILVSFAQNRIGDKICRFKKAYVASYFFAISALASLANQYLNSYQFCYLIGALWGGFSVYLQTIVGDLIVYIFPQMIQSGFSTYNFSYAVGLIIIVIINILLVNKPAWIILSILIMIGLIYIYIGSQLKYLNHQKEQLQNHQYEKINEEK